MRRASAVVSICLSLAAVAPAVAQDLRATDLALARLERALEAGSISEEAAAEGELRAWAADVAGRAGRQRQAFDALAASDLPAVAVDRLARTRAAFEAGQGRLAAILVELALPAGGRDEAARADLSARRERAALAREARDLVARLEAAARPEPLSSELKLRAPGLRAPALPAPTPGASSSPVEAPSAAAAAPIGVIPRDLQALADGLDGPLGAYLWVRQNVAPEFYYGAAKGALAAYRERRGNDADTAALLVTLLRAKGIPARFVAGTADVPADALRRLLGLQGAVEDGVRLLERAGIPNEPITGPGGLASVKLARVWAEAYIPYANYRGLELDAQGKAWVPLDAAFKLHAPAEGLDVVAALGFDPRAAWDAYQQEPRAESPLDFVRAQVEALLQAQRPGTTWDDVLARREIEPETLGILPNSLPYAATVAHVGYDLPEELTHAVRLVGEFQGSTVLDVTLPASRVVGQRLTLSYAPFSEDDAAVAARFGGLYQTPPYLVEVRALLNLDGIPVAQGEAPVGMGVKYALRLDLKTPAGTETVTNTLQAGNLAALALSGQATTLDELPDDAAGRILGGLAQRYLARWNQADDVWARLLRVVPVRPTLSAAFVLSAVRVDYAGGDPLYPLTFDWKGVAVDADFRPLAPVGLELPAREAPFALLSGLHGSWLEAAVLADDLQAPALSTVGIVQLAHQQGLTVHDLTRDNAEAIVPTLPFDATVKAELLDSALRGRLARVPAASVSSLAFTGVGYVLLDEASGEAAYQLQGGHSGGITTPAVNDLPTRWSLPLRGYQVGAGGALCNSVVPAKVEMKSRDNQFGLVDSKLEEKLEVLVLDARSQPLKDACVTFVVTGGGGKLVPQVGGEDSVVTVYSDQRGLARVELRLGKYTKDLPGYWCEDGRTCAPGQDEYTQVGINLVAVRAGAAVMSDTFTHFGKPDPACTPGSGANCATLRLTTPASRGGAFNLQIGGLMGAKVLDRYENPLSNVKVKFRFDPPLSLSSLESGWYHTRALANTAETPGLVLKPKDYLECIRTNMNPGRHDCANEAPQHILPSGPFGVYAYSVIGDSTVTDYKYEIAKEGSSFDARATFSTSGWICTSSDPHDCGLDWPQTLVVTTTRPRRVNAAGNFIEAYPVGTPGDLTVSADVVEEDNTVIPASGSPESDSCGEIWRARGNNVWKRKPLTNSTFNLSAESPGTGVPGSMPHVGNGDYRAQMTMAATPQENKARIQSKHFPPVVHLLDCRNDDDRVDPARSPISTVDGVRKAGRTPEPPGRPWQGGFTFPLWGAKVEIEKIEPQPVYVTRAGRTTHPTLVRHKVLPDEWRRLLDPVQVGFKLTKGNGPALTEGSGNRGEYFTIPRNLPLEAGTYQAKIEVRSVNLDDGKIEAQPKDVKAGVVDFLLDFNNDTKVDQADEAAAQANPAAVFGFWEADTSLDSDDVKLLQDYATLVIDLPEALGPDERLSVRLDQGLGALVMVPKLNAGGSGNCPADKAYLCSQGAADAQVAAHENQAVRSSNGAVALPSSWLAQGKNTFLFRCEPGFIGDRYCGGKVLSLERKIAGEDAALIDRSVDIKRVRQWMSAITVREPFNALGVAADARLMPNWAPVPDRSRKVFIFAHGYNVSASGGEDSWFPNMLKRFYWSGMPLLSVQGTEANGYPHMIGLTWPGDESVPGFPIDEFNALQSGVPVGLLLSRHLRGREIQMMAHSLGNMALNSALTLVRPGTVKSFVMYDAAVAAEAFSPAHFPDARELSFMIPEAQEQGYPDDAPWEEQWQSMVAHPNRPDLSCLYTPLPLRPPLSKWNANLANLNPNLAPQPRYQTRWRQFPVVSGRRQGAWSGYFVPPAGLRLINAYNPFDDIVRMGNAPYNAWYLSQSLQRPYSGWIFGAGFTDGNCVQYWGRLREDDVSLAAENALWAVGAAAPELGAPGPAARARLTRRWGEMTYWFPAISGGVGAQALPGGVGATQFEFSHNVLNPLTSHGYMNDLRLDEVWSHYVDLTQALR